MMISIPPRTFAVADMHYLHPLPEDVPYRIRVLLVEIFYYTTRRSVVLHYASRVCNGFHCSPKIPLIFLHQRVGTKQAYKQLRLDAKRPLRNAALRTPRLALASRRH